MSADNTLDYGTELPLDGSVDVFSEIVEVLAALGNEDSLSIFQYASQGISNSKEAIQVLGLTPKRFYTRLKNLVDNQLIEKIEGEYRYTLLGKIVHDMESSLEKLISNRDKLRVLNEMSKSKNLSEKERKELMDLVSVDVSAFSKEVRIVDSVESLISVCLDTINVSQDRVWLATQFMDNKIISAVFDAFQRGVETRIIVSKMDQTENSVNVLLSNIKSSKEASLFQRLLESSNVQMRSVKLPYTFLIVDDETCILEIKNQVNEEFSFAFHIQSEDSTNRMCKIFESFWDASEDIKRDI